MEKCFIVGVLGLSLVIHCDADLVTRTGNGSHRGEEGRLIRNLLDSGYDVRERPFMQDGGPVLFNLTLYLNAISDLDARTQVFSGISWLIMEWYDDRLTWDPRDYADIGSFTVNIDQTWSPKLYLQNTLLFTTQNIPIHLVRAESTFAVIRNKDISSEWNIVDHQTKSTFVSTKGKFTYEVMKIGFRLKRLPRFYTENMTSPIAFLSWLSMVIFVIPAKSGERLSAAVSLVLGLTVFQIVITDNMPKNSRGESVEVIEYVSGCFIVTIAVAVMTAIVINISHREGAIRNKLIRCVFFDHLGPWCLVGRGGCGRKKAPGPDPSESCKAGDLKMKDTGGRTQDRQDLSQDAGVHRQSSSRFNEQAQSEVVPDFELLARILDRIFMVATLVSLSAISLKFLIQI